MESIISQLELDKDDQSLPTVSLQQTVLVELF